jgi:AcrR family transcriptional regulator
MTRENETSSSPTAVGVDNPSGERRTQAERRAQAERALLDAAMVLFARRGVDQTSLADVGEQAGYSRGLVNHHFGSKAALVERLAQRSQLDFVSRLAEFDGDEVDVLVGFTRSYLAAICGQSDEARAFFVMWGAALPEEAGLQSVIAARDAQFRFGIESLLQLGQQKKTINNGIDPGGLAAVVVAMLRGMAAQCLIDADSVDLDAAGDACEQMLRRTLSPASAPRGRGRR